MFGSKFSHQHCQKITLACLVRSSTNSKNYLSRVDWHNYDPVMQDIVIFIECAGRASRLLSEGSNDPEIE